MSNSFDPERLFAEFTAKGVEFIVIGGIAATLHGAARPTQDVDVLVARDGGNLARLSGALQSLQAALRAGADEPIKLTIDADRLARGMNFSWTTEAGDIDTFGEVEGGFDYASVVGAAWQAITAAGTRIQVVSLPDLIAMKRASGRPKDQLALLELTELLDLQQEGGPGSGRAVPS